MEGLKWQLIQNKLIRDNNIAVTMDEMKDYARGMISRQYAQYGIPVPAPEVLEDHAMKILAGEKEGSQIRDNILGVKLLSYFKQVVKLNNKELPLDQFTNEALSGMGRAR
jgi:trigger factor